VSFQCVNLTDDELWRAIAVNTNALSLLVEQRLELDAEISASNDPESRAKLMRVHFDVVNRFQREYREYSAELRRRYPCVREADGRMGRQEAAGRILRDFFSATLAPK
jgi:predicted metal-dependent HD superfamily phosphohydrolase